MSHPTLTCSRTPPHVARRALGLILGLTLLTPAAALAGPGDKASGLLYTVPGVIQTSNLVTVVQCTNLSPTGSVPASFQVTVFDDTGTQVGSDSVSLVAGASGVITTGMIYSLPLIYPTLFPHAKVLTLASSMMGTAQILGPKTMACAAYVLAPGSTPQYMNALPVLSKMKQRGQ